MIYEVTAVNGSRDWESRNGAMTTFKLSGKLDGVSEDVQINTTKAKPKVPFVGEQIECEISKDDPAFGKTIKRAQTGVVSSFKGQPNKFVPSPATEAPYLSLKAAVEFAGYKLQAGNEISSTEVVTVAKVFQAYIEGELKPAIEPKDLPRDAQQITIDGTQEEEIYGEYI